MNIREKFVQYPADMQQWMIEQEKIKLGNIEKALTKGRELSHQLALENQGQWLRETTELLEQYLTLLPQRDCALEAVSQDYILQVWEKLDEESRLQELIAQVETRYQELLRI